MTPTPCQRYEQDALLLGNELHAGYFAAVAVDDLPQKVHRDELSIEHGYAVGIGTWYFFDAIEPAVTFGRAGRMSSHCLGYGVYAAAMEMAYCPAHGDEHVLHVLVTGGSLDRRPGEAELLGRFVESVRRHPQSSHWHELTGEVS